MDVFAVPPDNEAYSTLEEVDSLIITGPTRTNVSDIAVALFRP